MTSAVQAAEQAVAEARRDVHEFFVLLAASNADVARAAVARLEDAVRRHDAEIARTEGYLWSGEAGRAILQTADRIDPEADQTRDVEVRFADGPTIRIARHSVITEAATGLLVVEGFIAEALDPRTGQPRSGDAVRIAYLGIPGRGALVDVTADVKLFTRMEVLNIRIRTRADIDPEEPAP